MQRLRWCRRAGTREGGAKTCGREAGSGRGAAVRGMVLGLSHWADRRPQGKSISTGPQGEQDGASSIGARQDLVLDISSPNLCFRRGVGPKPEILQREHQAP
jgi:hypothetical protein